MVLVRRLLWSVPTVLLVTTAVFLLLKLAPGDPARAIVGENAEQETVELVRRSLGLDRPLPVQYGLYLSRLAQGDLGRSYHSRATVSSLVAARVRATAELAVVALALAALIGIPLGVFSAFQKGTVWDLAGTGLATLLVSAPTFWVGLILIVVFGVNLGWFPVSGRGTWQHLIMPAVTLAGYPLALIARLTRSECIEFMSHDFVRTARSKGLQERTILFGHVLKNASLPVVTGIGIAFGDALAGAVVIESVFGWPGIGMLVVSAIPARDLPVVQGGLLVIALMFLAVNIVVDILYSVLDPRIRFG